MPTGCKRSVQVLLVIHLFNDLFSRTTWASRYQKSKNSLDFKDMNEAKDHVVLGWQWHQLNHMQTMCTSLQTDNHINTSSLNFYRPGPWHRHSIFTGQMLFLMPNQQQQQQQQPFNGRLSGTTRVGRYQKKHSPAHTHPGQRTSFITFLHLQWSTASSLFSLRA